MTQQNIENIIQENVQLHTKVSVLEEQLENVRNRQIHRVLKKNGAGL